MLLAEYLQIHPLAPSIPRRPTFLNLEGVAIESPSFGKNRAQEHDLFGFCKEDDMDEHWCVSTFPAVFLLALAHPPERHRLDPDTLLPSTPHLPPRS